MSDPGFQADSKKIAAMFETWFDLGSEELIAKVKSVEAKEGRRIFAKERGGMNQLLQGQSCSWFPATNHPATSAIRAKMPH